MRCGSSYTLLYAATALFPASGYEDLLLDNVGGYVNNLKTWELMHNFTERERKFGFMVSVTGH